VRSALIIGSCAVLVVVAVVVGGIVVVAVAIVVDMGFSFVVVATAVLAGGTPRVGRDTVCIPWRLEGIADGVIPS
jgi:hypothetical protein